LFVKQQDQQAGIRRAQSLSIYDNTQVDLHGRPSLQRSRPTTPSRTATTTTPNTNVHLDPSENWKTGN